MPGWKQKQPAVSDPAEPAGAQASARPAGSDDPAEPEGAQVSVLSKDGEVLFVEAGSDFVDTLVRLLQQPLGAVVGCVGGAEKPKALSRLQHAIASLREPIFSNGKKDKAKHVQPPLDVAGLLGAAPELPELEVTPQHGCSIAVTSRGGTAFDVANSSGSGDYQAAAFTCPQADRSQHGGSFEVKWTHAANIHYMIGVAPGGQPQLSQQLGTNAGFYGNGFGFHVHVGNHFYYERTKVGVASLSVSCLRSRLQAGRQYCMRLSTTGGRPKLEFCEDGPDKRWEELTLPDGQQIPAKVQYVPVVHLGHVSSLTISSIEFGAPPGAPAVQPVFHPVARFLIANDLHICESSSLKALEIMQKHGLGSAASFEVRAATFGARELRRLIGRALCGETDVLDYALKGAARRPRDASPGSSGIGSAELISESDVP